MVAISRRHRKIRIFVRDQGEAEAHTADILRYGEDLRRGLNANIGRKDFFEMTSIKDRETFEKCSFLFKFKEHDSALAGLTEGIH